VEVRERIRINGRPLSREAFSRYFWHCYHQLEDSKVRAALMTLSFGIYLVTYSVVIAAEGQTCALYSLAPSKFASIKCY